MNNHTMKLYKQPTSSQKGDQYQSQEMQFNERAFHTD